MQLRDEITALTVDYLMIFAAVDDSSQAVALEFDATSGTGAEQPASAPEESDPTKLHSSPVKAAQTTSVDSDTEAVERLLRCPLTKVSAVFEQQAMVEASIKTHTTLSC